MPRQQIDIDDVTYEIRKDRSGFAHTASKTFYIKSGFPFCSLTDNMTRKQVDFLAQNLRSLGFTVLDRSV